MIFTATVTGDREDIAAFLREVAYTLENTKETNCLSSNGEWDMGPLTLEYLAPSWLQGKIT